MVERKRDGARNSKASPLTVVPTADRVIKIPSTDATATAVHPSRRSMTKKKGDNDMCEDADVSYLLVPITDRNK